MFYTDIQELQGLDEPIDYGSGIEYADGLLAYKEEGLQVGLWLNGTDGCQDIVDDVLDQNIERLFHYLVQCQAPKVFLRVGYEFDNPWFGYSHDPILYQRAFRRMVNKCRDVHGCRDTVIFVWHSWAAGLPANTTLQDFYPGDEFVDWVGISLFSQLYPNGTLGNAATVAAVLSFAENHDKPIMIAESTPFGGINKLKDPWNNWFEPVLHLIEEHDIAMWSYINCDWTSQPMWHGAGFGDARLSVNTTVMRLWQERVLSNPRFLQRETLCSQHRHFMVSSRLKGLTFTGGSKGIDLSVFWVGVMLIALFTLSLQFCRSRRRDGYVTLDGEGDFQIEDSQTGNDSLE